MLVKHLKMILNTWNPKKIGKFLDTDEDGFFEQVICYAGNGVVSHIWSDWNGDFSQEKAKIYVEIPNQKEMQEWSFVDNDGNGFFDEVKILDFVP